MIPRRADARALITSLQAAILQQCVWAEPGATITKSELLYGVEVSPRRTQDAAALAAFLPYVEVLDFPDTAAVHYAGIRADLKKRGVLIGANDLLIAAHARALGLTLVTNNTAARLRESVGRRGKCHRVQLRLIGAR